MARPTEDRSWRKRKMTFLSLSLLLASCWSSVGALSLRESENPIRRIVTLLQDMQKEIEAEGEKEEKAFNKFMCYCTCASFYRCCVAHVGCNPDEFSTASLDIFVY